MATVEASVGVTATVHEAEQMWYDTAGWERWVEGLERVTDVSGDWPRVGASVVWESGPAGRGHVTERVVQFDQLSGQTVEVEDDSIRARQSVAFVPLDDGVEVTLVLDYKLKRRSLVMPIVDALFIRNAMRASLRATLSRFAVEFEMRT
jgi:uncharacterized membrane protein